MASFSRTNQTVNKQGRPKERVKIFLNSTYLHKMQLGQRTAGTFPIYFEEIYWPDVWVSRFRPRIDKYVTVW